MLKIWWKESAISIPNLITEAPGPKSKSMHADTTRYMKWLCSQVKLFPVCFDKGYNITLSDVDGIKYLDFSSGIYVTSPEHCHTKSSEASVTLGKEFASAVARWCHLLDDNLVRPVITGVFDTNNETACVWFLNNFYNFKISCSYYRELLASDNTDVIYCAGPHNLHQEVYTDIIHTGKHLPGEKHFGIDLATNKNILTETKKRPDLVVRCGSEFPYSPGAKRVIDWQKTGKYGRLH